MHWKDQVVSSFYLFYLEKGKISNLLLEIKTFHCFNSIITRILCLLKIFFLTHCSPITRQREGAHLCPISCQLWYFEVWWVDFVYNFRLFLCLTKKVLEFLFVFSFSDLKAIFAYYFPMLSKNKSLFFLLENFNPLWTIIFLFDG